MSSWPWQGGFHLRRPSSRLASSGAHSELMVRIAGENVASRSRACAAVKHFDDSRDGLVAPLLSTRLMIFHNPGSMPSAKAPDAWTARSAKATAWHKRIETPPTG